MEVRSRGPEAMSIHSGGAMNPPRIEDVVGGVRRMSLMYAIYTKRAACLPALSANTV
jgi:hypothetical protein